MEEIIRIRLGDWLYNAGIVGFINIVGEENLKFEGQEVLIKTELLENFEEKYFKYFIDSYEKRLSWYKIVNIDEFLLKHEKEGFVNFEEKDMEILNEYISSAKKLITSNSHISAYDLIMEKYDIVGNEKKISIIKLKKGEVLKEKIEEVKEICKVIREIIEFYSKDESKKYIAGKNVIYTVVKNGWNGVSVLNPQTKEKNIYSDYKNYFPVEALNYLKEDKTKFKYSCFTCNSQIKNLDNEMSFLNCMGFDTTRKPSHAWNFNNDIGICPVCKLIYSCVPAGFTYVYNRGIYINENHSVENALKINNKIKTEILKDSEMNQNTTYKAVINAMQETINDNMKYELSDIQMVRYENNDGNEKYKFNILSKNMLRVIAKSKEDLNSIINAGFSEIKSYFRFYEEVMKLILNNENLFLLIHKSIVIKVSKPEDAKFHIGHIKNLININFEYLKGVGCMENIEKDILKVYSGAGYYLKQAYIEKSSDNKLNGISYRLLNALKTNNRGMFMDVILNCYLYTGKQVPSFFTDCMKDIELFKTIGYSFVTGLIDGEGKNKNSNGGNE